MIVAVLTDRFGMSSWPWCGLHDSSAGPPPHPRCSEASQAPMRSLLCMLSPETGTKNNTENVHGARVGVTCYFLSFFLLNWHLMRRDVMWKSLRRVRPLSIYTGCNPKYTSEAHDWDPVWMLDCLVKMDPKREHDYIHFQQTFFFCVFLFLPVLLLSSLTAPSYFNHLYYKANSTKLFFQTRSNAEVVQRDTVSLWSHTDRVLLSLVCLSHRLAACAFKYARESFTTLADTTEQLYGSPCPHVLSSHGRPLE